MQQFEGIYNPQTKSTRLLVLDEEDVFHEYPFLRGDFKLSRGVISGTVNVSMDSYRYNSLMNYISTFAPELRRIPTAPAMDVSFYANLDQTVLEFLYKTDLFSGELWPLNDLSKANYIFNLPINDSEDFDRFFNILSEIDKETQDSVQRYNLLSAIRGSQKEINTFDKQTFQLKTDYFAPSGLPSYHKIPPIHSLEELDYFLARVHLLKDSSEHAELGRFRGKVTKVASEQERLRTSFSRDLLKRLNHLDGRIKSKVEEFIPDLKIVYDEAIRRCL